MGSGKPPIPGIQPKAAQLCCSVWDIQKTSSGIHSPSSHMASPRPGSRPLGQPPSTCQENLKNSPKPARPGLAPAPPRHPHMHTRAHTHQPYDVPTSPAWVQQGFSALPVKCLMPRSQEGGQCPGAKGKAEAGSPNSLHAPRGLPPNRRPASVEKKCQGPAVSLRSAAFFPGVLRILFQCSLFQRRLTATR